MFLGVMSSTAKNAQFFFLFFWLVLPDPRKRGLEQEELIPIK